MMIYKTNVHCVAMLHMEIPFANTPSVNATT